ncbi:MAG: hypothetical protein GWN29_05030 [Gammaproteobacteria bacterium]|nr:site-specific DNA-methyltransferase [Gammaproteobacteria bacterium]NIV51117.1 hypothetical protein [Gammaproteobacteria bacterium]NIW23970.1 hypothetical protein [Gammaproteobacteria bacterium]NIX85058.1 hypothetical protein [Gammaproteobacteria bacterium]
MGKIIEGHAIDLISDVGALDLVVTDPPYAFGGSGPEHELSATVAVVLRECANRLARGAWMCVFSASSWRAINYVVEATRGIVSPVRIATWAKPVAKTKVRTVGWDWASVALVALRKGPKNRKELAAGSGYIDHIAQRPITRGRRAQLPQDVAEWAVAPFVVRGGLFLDPFAGSGALVDAAESMGMDASGFEIQPG